MTDEPTALPPAQPRREDARTAKAEARGTKPYADAPRPWYKQRRLRSPLLVAFAVITLVGNSCGSSKSSDSPARNASSIASALRSAVPSATGVVVLTEDNDPNNLLGRPNGYKSAAVVHDSGGECSDEGVDCGATVEVWGSSSDARARSEYIQGLQKNSPILGSEYDYTSGSAILRVSGKLKPSAAGKYQAAFTHPSKSQALPVVKTNTSTTVLKGAAADAWLIKTENAAVAAGSVPKLYGASAQRIKAARLDCKVLRSGAETVHESIESLRSAFDTWTRPQQVESMLIAVQAYCPEFAADMKKEL